MQRLLALDTALRAWATTHHAPWVDVLMAALSLAGEAGLVWLAVGAVAAIRRPRLVPLLWQLALAIALSHVAVDVVLKPSIARSRPFAAIRDARVVGTRPATYSLPSGHAASAVAGAYITTLMLPAGAAVLWTLAGLIAVSRVYVGVHYPLDILVGAAVGWTVAVLVTGGRAWYSQDSSAAQHSVAR